MKTLYDCLLETRETVKMHIPFDLFDSFMRDAIIDMNYDDSEWWKPMRELVTDLYGAKVWRWFYGFCESYLQVKSEMSIEQFYDNIKRVPLDRFERVIGAGSEGIVLDVNDDKVIKISYSKTFGKTEAKFYEYCSKHKSNVFPVIYKLGKNWCVMEKLEPHTKKCNDYIKTIEDRTTGFRFISDICKGILPDTSTFSDIQKEVYDWCIAVKTEMEDNKISEYPGDLGINNIGERSNGDIVFFDI